MSTADEFWQYAKEAALSACDAKTESDKQAMLNLAGTWTLAALMARRSRQSDRTPRQLADRGSVRLPSETFVSVDLARARFTGFGRLGRG